MYQARTLYYLKHIGIRPWVKKEAIYPAHDAVRQASVLVFAAKNLSAKGHALLHQMTAYLDTNIEVAFFSSEDGPAKYQSKVHLVHPLVVLNFIDNPLINEQMAGCPVVHAINPEELLSHPIKKKNVFLLMNQLKKQIL